MIGNMIDTGRERDTGAGLEVTVEVKSEERENVSAVFPRLLIERRGIVAVVLPVTGIVLMMMGHLRRESSSSRSCKGAS